ncbi:MAG: hypothetical protein A2Y33_11775 [Spirochaetes bacterium GWF1_51_8]|nr:MAG: hypothetical protein A2Y33_11775 [Spirochaetes bacterium GWF1_51_8]
MKMFGRILVFGVMIALAGMLYPGDHTRTVKNAGNTEGQKVIVIIEQLTDFLDSAASGLDNCETQTEAEEYIENIAKHCLAEAKRVMEIFEKTIVFMNDTEFMTVVQEKAERMESMFESFKDKLAEWADNHQLSEEEKNELNERLEEAFSN